MLASAVAAVSKGSASLGFREWPYSSGGRHSKGSAELAARNVSGEWWPSLVQAGGVNRGASGVNPHNVNALAQARAPPDRNCIAAGRTHDASSGPAAPLSAPMRCMSHRDEDGRAVADGRQTTAFSSPSGTTTAGGAPPRGTASFRGATREGRHRRSAVPRLAASPTRAEAMRRTRPRNRTQRGTSAQPGRGCSLLPPPRPKGRGSWGRREHLAQRTGSAEGSGGTGGVKRPTRAGG